MILMIFWTDRKVINSTIRMLFMNMNAIYEYECHFSTLDQTRKLKLSSSRPYSSDISKQSV